MTETLAGVLLLIGGLFMLVAGIGIYRMPDVFIRMHASTKVGTLGSGLIMAGVALHFWDMTVVYKVVSVVLFLLLTAPIGAHMIGRAALRIGVRPWGIDNTAAGQGVQTGDDAPSAAATPTEGDR